MSVKFTNLFNSTRVAYLLSLPQEEFESILYNGSNNKTEAKAYYAGVKRYLKKINKCKNGEDENTYKFARGRTDGRLYSSLGMQNLKGNVRNFLTEEYCKDIDMINCHPTIISYLCKQENIPSPYLDAYNLNRDVILEREELNKEEINTMINCDIIKPNNQSDWLLGFLAEIFKIKEIIFAKNSNDLLEGYKKNNKKSSVLNFHCCIIENRCLQLAVNHIKPENVRLLSFDGLYAKPLAEVDFDTLNELTSEYGLTWKQKQIHTNIIMPDDYISIESAWKSDKEELEKTFAILKDPPCILHEMPHGNAMYSFSNFNDIAAPYFNDNFKSDDWKRDKNRREYNKMEFLPYSGGTEQDISPEYIYNTFKPFAASEEEYTDEDIQPFLDHIHINLCDEEKIASDWLLKLLAWRIQNPGKLPKVAVILKGLQGAGKDRTMDIMNLIMGSSNQYIYSTSNMGELFGQFNSAVKNKLIIICNETTGASGCKYKEPLKEVIMKEFNNINEKNIKPYILLNFALIFVFSNNLTPVQIPYDDRRYVLIETGRKNIGNEHYWGALSKLMEDPSWINKIFSYLSQLDLTDFDPSSLEGQPKTKAYIDSQLDTIHPVYYTIRALDMDKLKIVQNRTETSGMTWINTNEFAERVSVQNENNDISQKIINKLLRSVRGVILGKKITVNGKQQSCIIFDRQKVEDEIFKRIFKNVSNEVEEELFCNFIESDDEEVVDSLDQ